MMTIDDEGEGVWTLANNDVITEINNFWDFTRNFSKIYICILVRSFTICSEAFYFYF